MKGKGENICPVCKVKVFWWENKIRIVQETQNPETTEERRLSPSIKNIKIFHTKCYTE